MGFEPFFLYCHPIANGIWAKAADGAFGAYTPCVIDSLVMLVSHFVLLGLCLYRIWLICRNAKGQIYVLRNKYYNCLLGILACYCAIEPLLRLVARISLFNMDEETDLPPFEMASLIIEALTWLSMLALTALETKRYIKEFRWYVRFGVVYVLVADAVLLDLVLPLKDSCNRTALYLCISSICFQVCQTFIPFFMAAFGSNADTNKETKLAITHLDDPLSYLGSYRKVYDVQLVSQ